jgi:hypothetical protein
MSEPEIQFRKKRETGDIFTDSFKFIKTEFRPVMWLLIVYVSPFIIVYGILQAYISANVLGRLDLSDAETMLKNLGPFYLNLLLVSLFGIFVQSLLAGTYYTYIKAYVTKGKGNFRLDEITPSLFANTLLALGANLVFFVIVVFGVLMCILPGIFLANSLSLVLMIIIFEKKGLSNALHRSWKLVHTQWWNTLLICMLGLVILYVASFITAAPLMYLTIESTQESYHTAGLVTNLNWYWLISVISTVISSFCYVVPYTFLAFQYFNLEERN